MLVVVPSQSFHYGSPFKLRKGKKGIYSVKQQLPQGHPVFRRRAHILSGTVLRILLPETAYSLLHIETPPNPSIGKTE